MGASQSCYARSGQEDGDQDSGPGSPGSYTIEPIPEGLEQVVYPKYEEALRLGLAAFSNPMRTNKFRRQLPHILGTLEFQKCQSASTSPVPAFKTSGRTASRNGETRSLDSPVTGATVGTGSSDFAQMAQDLIDSFQLPSESNSGIPQKQKLKARHSQSTSCGSSSSAIEAISDDIDEKTGPQTGPKAPDSEQVVEQTGGKVGCPGSMGCVGAAEGSHVPEVQEKGSTTEKAEKSVNQETNSGPQQGLSGWNRMIKSEGDVEGAPAAKGDSGEVTESLSLADLGKGISSRAKASLPANLEGGLFDDIDICAELERLRGSKDGSLVFPAEGPPDLGQPVVPMPKLLTAGTNDAEITEVSPQLEHASDPIVSKPV